MAQEPPSPLTLHCYPSLAPAPLPPPANATQPALNTSQLICAIQPSFRTSSHCVLYLSAPYAEYRPCRFVHSAWADLRTASPPSGAPSSCDLQCRPLLVDPTLSPHPSVNHTRGHQRRIFAFESAARSLHLVVKARLVVAGLSCRWGMLAV
jgi:hypothetical protein